MAGKAWFEPLDIGSAGATVFRRLLRFTVADGAILTPRTEVLDSFEAAEVGAELRQDLHHRSRAQIDTSTPAQLARIWPASNSWRALLPARRDLAYIEVELLAEQWVMRVRYPYGLVLNSTIGRGCLFTPTLTRNRSSRR